MAIDSGKDALRQVPLFSSLEDALLERLAGELDQESFPAGAAVIREGDATAALYVIRAGRVKVTRAHDGVEAVLAVFGPGDCVGELALCDGCSRSASVIALEPTSTYVLPAETFARFVLEHPAAALTVMNVLAVRFRTVSERLTDTMFLTVSQRVAKRLLELAAEHAGQHSGAAPASFSLTLDEIASLAGAMPAQVEEEMRVLKEGGVIDWDGASVTLRSPALLQERTRGGARFIGLGHVTVPRWLLEP